MTPSGGTAAPVAANQQVTIAGGESPRVETAAVPTLTAWDRWNYQRTDYLAQPASAKPSPGGRVRRRSARPARNLAHGRDLRQRVGAGGRRAGLVALLTGRWIWDPRFGWTWLDDAPWGWAPYHTAAGSSSAATGRGPRAVLVRPVYSPALVVFLGGPVVVGSAALLGAARLGRAGDPVVGPAGLRRRAVVGRLGRPARGQQRRDQPHPRWST